MDLNKGKLRKISFFISTALAIGLVLYLVVLPLYPKLKYNLSSAQAPATAEEAKAELTVATEEVRGELSRLPETEYAVSKNRLIIPKIDVNAPIVEDSVEQRGLDRGAWRLPESSTPDKGGNTVITGHRFKYLPPHNMTFYLFDKLVAGDLFSVIWEGETRYYEIKTTKVVEPTDFSILEPTASSTITMFTCTPVYSTDFRLVVVGEEME